MLLQVPTANDMAGWRPVNLGNAVNLGWVQAADGPTNEREGYLSMSTGTANGSVAVDVPSDLFGVTSSTVTNVPFVSDKEGEPPPSLLSHVHFINEVREKVPALAFSLWLRAAPTTAIPVNVAVALWAIPENPDAGVQTFAYRAVRLNRQWQRFEVVHGPFQSFNKARCEVYAVTANRPIHIAGASLH